VSKQKQQPRKGTDKLKDAMRSGSNRPIPAAAFMETPETKKENDAKQLKPETSEDNDSVNRNSKKENNSVKRNSFPEQETEEHNSNIKTVDENLSVKQNNDQEHTNKNLNHIPEPNDLNASNNSTTEKDHVKEQVNHLTHEDSIDFWSLIENEKKKKTVEETHTRQTYLIRNDILDRLQKNSMKQGKGFKTKVINYALEQFLDELEK
jgi:hypothetical protein